ncbi:hypothetical protein SNEBB_005952 [Seison nebaliae]|nr:hypothetical protein SNEBB_005952 [Seison nebaliae]
MDSDSDHRLRRHEKKYYSSRSKKSYRGRVSSDESRERRRYDREKRSYRKDHRSRSKSHSKTRSHRHRHSSTKSKSPDRHKKSTNIAPGPFSANSNNLMNADKHPKPVIEDKDDIDSGQRTVFLMQLPLKVRERDIEEFFAEAGKVRDVQLIMDSRTRKFKGCGYVEFAELESVASALAMHGQPILGHPIVVRPTNADKNRPQPPTTGASVCPTTSTTIVVPSSMNDLLNNNMMSENTMEMNQITSSCCNMINNGNSISPSDYGNGAAPNDMSIFKSSSKTDQKVADIPVVKSIIKSGPMKLYVGNLHFNINEDMLELIFSSFGSIDQIRLIREETDVTKFSNLSSIIPYGEAPKLSKCFAFVTFKDAEDAQSAMEKMNGFQLVGRSLRIEISDNSISEMSNISNPVSVQPAVVATQCLWITGLFKGPIISKIKDELIILIKEQFRTNNFLIYHIYIDVFSILGHGYIKLKNISMALKCIQFYHNTTRFNDTHLTFNFIPSDHYHRLFPYVQQINEPIN